MSNSEIVSTIEKELYKDCPWMIDDPDAIHYFVKVGEILVPCDKDGNIDNEALRIAVEVQPIIL